MSELVLELDHVAVHGPVRGTVRTLVHDCTLQVRAGEALGLVGESGSGKTLSVRAVAGLLPEAFEVAGTIRIDGEDISALAPRRLREVRARRIGLFAVIVRADPDFTHL